MPSLIHARRLRAGMAYLRAEARHLAPTHAKTARLLTQAAGIVGRAVAAVDADRPAPPTDLWAAEAEAYRRLKAARRRAMRRRPPRPDDPAVLEAAREWAAALEAMLPF